MHGQQSHLLVIQAQPIVAEIRTSELFGDEHTIVPCVALVEGVLWPSNAPAPELALAEEFGRFPDGWNGRPVVLNHPQINGVPVSASHPKILEDVGIGQLFNTTVENGKLKTEIWINNDRLKDMPDDVKESAERLMAGEEVVEVSTGLYTMSEMSEGVFEGQEFSAIWRNIVPDHLAILPEGVTGACSVEGGCGAPRTNKGFKPVMNASRITVNCGVDCKGKAGGECSCKDNPAPVKLEAGVVGNGETPPKRTKPSGIFEKLAAMAGRTFLRGSSKDISDRDIRTALGGVLRKAEDFFFIVAIFEDSDGAGTFVYETWDTLYSRDYTISGTKVNISEERTEVRPITQFVPLEEATGAPTTSAESEDAETNGSIQENKMNDKDKLVTGLIDNEATQFTADDKAWLDTLEVVQLEKLVPTANSTEEEEEVVTEVVAVETAPLGNGSANVPPISTEDYIKGAPPEVQAVLNESIRLHNSRKDALIKGVLANTRNSFTEVQLKAKDLSELTALAALASPDVSYEGLGLAPTTNAADEKTFAAAPTLFDLKSTKAA